MKDHERNIKQHAMADQDWTHFKEDVLVPTMHFRKDIIQEVEEFLFEKADIDDVLKSFIWNGCRIAAIKAMCELNDTSFEHEKENEGICGPSDRRSRRTRTEACRAG